MWAAARPGAGLAPRADGRVRAALRPRRRCPRLRRVDRVAPRAAHDRAGGGAPAALGRERRTRCWPVTTRPWVAERGGARGRRGIGVGTGARRAGSRGGGRVRQRTPPAAHPEAGPEVRRPRRPSRSPGGARDRGGLTTSSPTWCYGCRPVTARSRVCSSASSGTSTAGPICPSSRIDCRSIGARGPATADGPRRDRGARPGRRRGRGPRCGPAHRRCRSARPRSGGRPRPVPRRGQPACRRAAPPRPRRGHRRSAARSAGHRHRDP